MNPPDVPLLRIRLKEDEQRRKMQTLSGRLLAIAGIIFVIGLIGILIAPLNEEQADKVIFGLSVLVSLFLTPGILFGIMGRDQH